MSNAGSLADPGGTGLLLAVERFNPARHATSRFTCGKVELDTYIQSTVQRDEADRTAVTYVLVDSRAPGDTRRVIGYFTLNSTSFPKGQGRRRDRDRNLGAYDPVPALLIGRLALDAEFHGRGLGSVVLFEALYQALHASTQVGAAVAVVHAIDDSAARFYEYQGFTRFRDRPDHLYYPFKTFIKAVPPHRLTQQP